METALSLGEAELCSWCPAPPAGPVPAPLPSTVARFSSAGSENWKLLKGVCCHIIPDVKWFGPGLSACSFGITGTWLRASAIFHPFHFIFPDGLESPKTASTHLPLTWSWQVGVLAHMGAAPSADTGSLFRAVSPGSSHAGSTGRSAQKPTCLTTRTSR